MSKKRNVVFNYISFLYFWGKIRKRKNAQLTSYVKYDIIVLSAESISSNLFYDCEDTRLGNSDSECIGMNGK